MRRTAQGALLALLFLAAGCGQHVAYLSIHDPRLPPSAQKWVADAEDQVAVATAWLDEATATLAAVQAWRASVGSLEWPGGPLAELTQMADKRVELARLEHARAQAELRLSMERRKLVNAETAMRYDLGVYDLTPLRKETERLRTEARKLDDAIEEARRALEETTTAWWKAFRAYVAGGGKTEVLWIQL
ncbi:MAG: hypothetical protein D6729_03525 [Deltaproteobacteria bacterium]|nr:MAG: hypothetical protein D6729_03525 [Deltaproteobacteria bacterium]